MIPVFEGEADVRGAFGGRGSAKTMSFAKMTAVRSYIWDMAGREGVILCGREYMNSLDDSSLAEVKAAIRSEPWLLPHFDIGEKYVRTASGRIHYAFSGLDRSIDSIKSKSKILLGWVDEAEPVAGEAWQTLIPTLREEDSELWVTWNPRRKGSRTNQNADYRFRQTQDPRYKVVELNWRDNPRFPEKLNRDRLRDLANNPDQYEHIWEGAYASSMVGSYYAQDILRAKQERRIGGRVSADPLMSLRAFVDIGGTGARADAFVMWIGQFVGKEVRALDYYEAVGQPLSAHLAWLRDKKYHPQIWLPHDGETHDRVHDASFEGAFKQAGYEVEVVKNQGRGAARARVEAGRRMFPAIWFDEKTQPGVDALGWYHEKRDDHRGIGLGPEHDFSSHGADAFGLMCIVAESSPSTAPVNVETLMDYASPF